MDKLIKLNFAIMIKAGLAVLILALVIPASALHIKGGWMSYRYIGTTATGDLEYEITVKVFRDCGTQSPGQNDPIINVTFFSNNPGSAGQTFVATQTRSYFMRKTSFSPCITPVPEVCYVVLEYMGRATLKPDPAGYTAAFQRCCRINGIVNVEQPSNNLGNTYSIKLPANVIDANFVQNSSPVFFEKDTAVVCFNSNFTLDYSAEDPDGDSLVYEFAPALSGGSTNQPNPPTATSPPYNSLPYVNPYSYDNPFGTNVKLDRATGIITGISPAATGEYVVAVLIKEYRGSQYIAETRKELHVNVANCTVPDADLPLEAVQCDGFEVQFENRSFSPAITSYYWDFGAPNRPGNTTDLSKPTFVYGDTGTYLAKLIVNRGQACTDSATIAVKVYPGFSPGFVADGSCFSNPFQFRDTTFARHGVVNSWRWDFGVTAAINDTSLVKNPNFTFPVPGTYMVTLRSTSSKGCADTVIIPVSVLDKPLLNLPFKDTLICSIDSLRLRAIGTGTFSWTPSTGRIINAFTPTPTVYPLKTTVYRVTINDRGCVTNDSVKVNVLDFISVDAGRDTTICLTDKLQLRPVTQGLSFRWSPASTLNDPTLKNPLATPSGKTTYRVIANLGKCQDTDTVTITTVPYPKSVAGIDTAICFGNSANLNAIAEGIRFQWTPTTGLSNPSSLITRAAPQQTTLYTLLAYDNKGCPKPGVSTVEVKVVPRVVLFAGRDTSLVFGQPIQFSASSNVVINTWSPATGLNDSTSLSPILTLKQSDLVPGTDYLIYRLKGSTTEGCKAEDDLIIRIFSTKPTIFVPNAFTPNQDGLNDNIRPILAGIRRLEFFRIFNRYGQIIFESTEPESSWDGIFKGNPQGSGAFVYQVQALDYEGKLLRQSGTFLLIR